MNEPLWKTALNWGVISMFLTLPMVVFAIHLYALTHAGWIYREKMPDEFKYVLEFERNLAILVFGLAGLRTWEQLKNGKSPSPHNEQPKDPK
jgi:hypothetical protein